jgi:hypothetical protein
LLATERIQLSVSQGGTQSVRSDFRRINEEIPPAVDWDLQLSDGQGGSHRRAEEVGLLTFASVSSRIREPLDAPVISMIVYSSALVEATMRTRGRDLASGPSVELAERSEWLPT